MIALDTSVVVAGFGAWHEHHRPALKLLAEEPRLAAHTALESYSLLTRLPEPFRADAETVVEYLRRTFTGPRLGLDPATQDRLPDVLAGYGVDGGAVYDGLIALTAQAAGAELVTLDRRALATYARCQVTARVLAV